MASGRDLKVRELTKLAKERGLKGYSKKNKSELVRLLESQENSVPVLTPQTPSRVKRFKEYAADKRQIFKKYANYKWNSFVNWLTGAVGTTCTLQTDIISLWRMLSASLVIFRKTQKKHGQSHVIPY